MATLEEIQARIKEVEKRKEIEEIKARLQQRDSQPDDSEKLREIQAIKSRLQQRNTQPEPVQIDPLDRDHPLISTETKEMYRRLEDVAGELGYGKLGINSGHRTPEKNKAVGGKPGSKHLTGDATDLILKNSPDPFDRKKFEQIAKRYRQKYGDIIWGGEFKDPDEISYNHFAPVTNKHRQVNTQPVKPTFKNPTVPAYTQKPIKKPDTIPEMYKYPKANNALEKMGQILDYPANYGRTAIDAWAKDEDVGKNTQEALDKKRYTDIEHVKKTLGIPTFGKEGEGFQWGDIPDVAINVGLDTTLDPTTYASMLIPIVGNAAVGMKVVGNVAKYGSKAMSMNKFLAGKTATKKFSEGVIGGIYGYGASDGDAPTSEKLRNAAIGAVTLPLGMSAGKKASPKIGKIMDNLGDQIGKHKAARFGIDSLSQAKRWKDQAMDKVNFKHIDILQKFRDPLKKLNNSEKATFWKQYNESVYQYNGYRNELWNQEMIELLDTNPESFMKVVGGENFWKDKAAAVRNLDSKVAATHGFDNLNPKDLTNDITKKLHELQLKDPEIYGKIGLTTTRLGVPIPKFGSLKTSEAKLIGMDVTRKANESVDEILQRNFITKNAKMEKALEEYQKRVPQIVDDLNAFHAPIYREEGMKAAANNKKLKSQTDIDNYVDQYVKDRMTVSKGIFSPVVGEKDPLAWLPGEPKSTSGWKAGTFEGKPPKRRILGVDGKDAPKMSDKQFLKETKASIDIYAKKVSTKFLTEAEKDIMGKLAKYKVPETIFEESVRTLDNLITSFKNIVLLGSTKWLVTNHTDNVIKAYTERGALNALETAIPRMNPSIVKDVDNVLKGNINGDFLNELTPFAIERGLIDSGMVKEITSKELKEGGFEKFFINPTMQKEIEEQSAKRSSTKMGKLNKAFESWNDKSSDILTARFSVGRVSNKIENIAKMVTFKNTYESMRYSFRSSVPFTKGIKIGDSSLYKNMVDDIMKSGNVSIEVAMKEADRMMMDEAVGIAKDTFFDYQESVGHFENAVIKRIFPFYSFEKNNLAYWANSLTDVDKARRWKQTQRTIYGNPQEREISEKKREGMSDYLRNDVLVPRGKNKFGDKYFHIPNLSSNEAINTGMKAFETLMEMKTDPIASSIISKLNPAMKSAYEMAANTDLFQKGEFFPSDRPGETKHMFSQAFKYYFGQELIDNLTRKDMDLFGMYLDERKNPITDSDTMVVIDKIMQLISVIPYQRTIEQLISAYGKSSTGKQEVMPAFMESVLPIKETTVSNASQKYMKNKARKDRFEEMRNASKTKIKKRKLERSSPDVKKYD